MLRFRSAVLLSGFVVASGISLSPPSHAQLWDQESLPIVLTPARLKQSRSEVPASVSVIDRRMIEASGIRKIPELFRLIPGTFVGARDGWNYVVSYHGTNYRDSRRMQVLIDGRSAYQPGLATVDWNDIPLSIEDIERIEIVRGPSTASYGANAFLGVINIITRHPADTEQLQLQAKRGDGKIEDYRLAHSGDLGNGNFRVTLASRRDDGFDKKADGSDRRDSDNSDLINFRYDLPVDTTNLQLGMGYKEGWITDDINVPWITPQDTYTEDFYLSGKLAWELTSTHSQHFRLDYSGQKQLRPLTAIIPPEFIGLNNYPAGLVLADTNEDSLSRRSDVEFQDTMIWNKKMKTVSGLHYKNDFVNSKIYYNGRKSNDSFQIFTNLEYRWSPSISSNAGMSWEDDSNEGNFFSPRAALHYHFDPNHSLRAVYSEAVRTPDLLETSVDWNYYADNVRELDGTQQQGMTTGVYHCSTQGNKWLDPETIRSKELGYYGNFQELGLQLDIKIFRDQLRNLISASINCDEGYPENANYLNQKGAEIEIDYRPSPQWLIHGTYSRVLSDTNRSTEASFTPPTAASLLLAYTFAEKTTLSAARYYTEDTPLNQRNTTFSRSDIKLSHQISIARHTLELSYLVRVRHDQNIE